LDHGDLWPSNILIDDSAAIVIDWEDACVNQPFLSLGPLIAMMREWRVDLPLERVAAAYLAAFGDIGRNADLNRAFALSVPLALLDMAVRYWQVSAEMSSLHPWMREMVPFFMRHLIEMRRQ
jgi:thiamine kinase-like enzyme